MNEGIITAVVGAASATAGYVVSYLTIRRNEQRQLRNEQRQEQRQLNEAELSYMVRLQEMLVDSARRLTEAETAHTQQIIKLEKAKYLAEEELKQAVADHKRIVQSLTVESNDQDTEIRLYIAERELFEKEIDRLNGILTELGVPVVKFNLPHRPNRD